MKFSAENPRYTAYTTNAFGTTEAGRTNRKAEAWTMAAAATKQAEAERPGINHEAAIFDKAAGTSGSMCYRVKAQPAKTEFRLMYLSNPDAYYDAPAFPSRKAAQAYKDEHVVERGIEIMTAKQLAAYIKAGQQCATQEELDSKLDRILNR